MQEQPSRTPQTDTSGLRALFFLFAFAMLAAMLIGLTGCSDDPREARKRCAVLGPEQYGGRGGVFQPCVKEELGCMSPLTLEQNADGKFVCNLRRGENR